MAKILLVDGYNAINRIPELRPYLDRGLEEARTQLAFQIDKWRSFHPGCECIIVFDGDHKVAMPREQRISGIRCIFSASRHGGDDEIIRIVRNSRDKATDITVVSDDNNVIKNCRTLGASVMPTHSILPKKAPSSGGKRSGTSMGKKIDKKAEGEITEELRRKLGL